jgi:catechol 2,3-dioxygenase-like lactoylglutathione lyase family enzyme
MDYKLELIVVPATDVDRSKQFYVHEAGFEELVDVSPGGKFRVVQLSPKGSACAIALMHVPERAGQVQGLHLVVEDVVAARAELVGRGMRPSEPFHFAEGVQTEGLDPQRNSYQSFFQFADPDGNLWLVQEVKRRG